MLKTSSISSAKKWKETWHNQRSCKYTYEIWTFKPQVRIKLYLQPKVVRGKTNSFIQLDEDEAKKVQVHGDAVLKKLQRIHKSIVWNFIVGRSFVDRISKSKQPTEEINLDHDENLEFDPKNPRVSFVSNQLISWMTQPWSDLESGWINFGIFTSVKPTHVLCKVLKLDRYHSMKPRFILKYLLNILWKIWQYNGI